VFVPEGTLLNIGHTLFSAIKTERSPSLLKEEHNVHSKGEKIFIIYFSALGKGFCWIHFNSIQNSFYFVKPSIYIAAFKINVKRKFNILFNILMIFFAQLRDSSNVYSLPQIPLQVKILLLEILISIYHSSPASFLASIV
jgi:hypothetical protein